MPYSIGMSNAAQTEPTMFEVIQSDTYTDEQLDKVGALNDTFAYTSTLLVALADHLSGLGDSKAHMMLLAMAEQMARHEAEVA